MLFGHSAVEDHTKAAVRAQPCILSERPAADNHPTETPH